MISKGAEIEKEWADYIIQDIPGLKSEMVKSYIDYLLSLRLKGLEISCEDLSIPQDMKWVQEYADSNLVKTDFFEGKVTAYAKASSLVDDL